MERKTLWDRYCVTVQRAYEEGTPEQKARIDAGLAEFTEMFQRYMDKAEQFLGFVERIPVGAEAREEPEEKRIGIVLLPAEWGNWYLYSICIGILLDIQGYPVTFLVDDLMGCEEYMYHRGITSSYLEIMQIILDAVVGKRGSVEVKYLSRMIQEQLDVEDLEVVDKVYRFSMDWLWGHHFVTGDFYKELLEHNAGYVKRILLESGIDCYFVYTGLLLEKGLYGLLGQKYGKRVASYDTNVAEDYLMLSEDKPVAWLNEVCEIIHNNALTEEERRDIVKKMQDKYKNIRDQAANDTGGDRYDVVIPLNIAWDSAVLGQDHIFASEKEWMMETLRFLLNKTDASILVREHPASRNLQWHYYEDYAEIIKNIEGYDERRIRYASCKEDLSIYECIINARLVIPYTTTVGMEAALLGKKVIVSTNVYYGRCGVGECANDREDYFRKIINYLKNDYHITESEKETASLAIYLHSHMGRKTYFHEMSTKWMEKTCESLLADSAVISALKCVATGESYMLQNFRGEEL